MALPKRKINLGENFYVEVDSVGMISFVTWVPGTAPILHCTMNPYKTKKLSAWLSKVLNFVERP